MNENDEARMTNDEGMTKLISSFVLGAFIRHSSFVIRHFALVSLFTFAASAFAVEPLEEIVQQRYEVDANATLSVQNLDGSIRVYAAEEPVIRIEAIKKAYNKERLQGIVVDVKASRSSVSITTSVPPRKNALSDRSGTVDYVIVVPQSVKITQLDLAQGEVLLEGLRNGGSAKAHLGSGWLGAHNCFGNLDLSVETGRLDIAYDWWENHELAIKALAASGNMHVIFPSDASINLSAMAPEGRIANGFGPKGPGDLVHSVAEVIGPEARTVVSLEVRSGNIRIDKMIY